MNNPTAAVVVIGVLVILAVMWAFGMFPKIELQTKIAESQSSSTQPTASISLKRSPEKVGFYINKEWGRPLQSVLGVDKPGVSGSHDIPAGFAKGPVYRIPSSTFDLYYYPAASAPFGIVEMYKVLDDGKTKSERLYTFIGNVQLNDECSVAKWQVTIPGSGKYIVLDPGRMTWTENYYLYLEY